MSLAHVDGHGETSVTSHGSSLGEAFGGPLRVLWLAARRPAISASPIANWCWANTPPQWWATGSSSGSRWRCRPGGPELPGAVGGVAADGRIVALVAGVACRRWRRHRRYRLRGDRRARRGEHGPHWRHPSCRGSRRCREHRAVGVDRDIALGAIKAPGGGLATVAGSEWTWRSPGAGLPQD